ncbi:hypothetical protein [Winogradskyella tangerina]|uniref:hypothetical protein n=1 Tax=Winogradskyella tangerina TaxID=2023240 RepID=UPI000DBE1FBB|nr:hypothetical protein [Winogradskyella tangerina]
MNQDSKVTKKKLKTESKTLRLEAEFVSEIETLAERNYRNFNNMAETLMRIGMQHYPGLELRT